MDEKIPHRWFQREGLWRSAQRGGVVWISRRAHNPEIDGSNPSLVTINYIHSSHALALENLTRSGVLHSLPFHHFQ